MVFGIRGNIARTELPEIVYKLIKDLDKKKIQFLIENELGELINKEFPKSLRKENVSTPQNLVKNSDYLISIGGDGTFLATAKLVNSRGIPIIGVNMGKLGYLAEISLDKISGFVSDILDQKFKIEERTVLSARSNLSSKEIHGINEIVINQNGLVKTIFIEVFYNNDLVISFHADGLLVATPTGSTAYSLSTGGPIVIPGTNVIIVSPICPHTFTARPIILPDNGLVKVVVEYKTPIAVTADGNTFLSLKKDAEIEIWKAPYKIKVVKPVDSNYFKVLNKKLLWGEDKRKSK